MTIGKKWWDKRWWYEWHHFMGSNGNQGLQMFSSFRRGFMSAFLREIFADKVDRQLSLPEFGRTEEA